MKQLRRTKSAGGILGLELEGQDLARINEYTRREFTAEELFAFKVTLCDNRVDRDWERFTVPALRRLAELFRGKTGIFDHQPTARGQIARIYATEVVEVEGAENGTGEPLTQLQARAYMLRDESTMPVIRSIEAGILKEVSVGCLLDKVTCSICGADIRREECPHWRGTEYGEERCHYLLEDPVDAYEFSFVPVPAQPGAGVTKGMKEDGGPLWEALGQMQAAVQRMADLLEEQGAPQEGGEGESPPDSDPEAEALLESAKQLLLTIERSTEV